MNFPLVNFQSSVKEKRSIFDVDELEDENSYKCYNCSAISPSLANLYEHVETCDEEKDQQENRISVEEEKEQEEEEQKHQQQ